jgi:hypothetical protein
MQTITAALLANKARQLYAYAGDPGSDKAEFKLRLNNLVNKLTVVEYFITKKDKEELLQTFGAMNLQWLAMTSMNLTLVQAEEYIRDYAQYN